MKPTRPSYVLAPAGAAPNLDGLFPGRALERVAEASALRFLAPGLLLLPIGALDGDDVVTALAIAADGPSESGWLPVFVQAPGDGRPARLLPVSLGWPADAGELARWLDGADDAHVFELRHVLTRVARGRHDLNNPLTSAMAEIQLALMDAHDPAIRKGLETVEEQLRRIRDLVAGLRTLRAPF
jgi:signal transduction histidine kinase